jgi:hypothetical protein
LNWLADVSTKRLRLSTKGSRASITPSRRSRLVSKPQEALVDLPKKPGFAQEEAEEFPEVRVSEAGAAIASFSRPFVEK